MKKIFYLILIFFSISIQVNAQCWARISAGNAHTLAIKNDGTLWAWGFNQDGQLGDGTNTNRTFPVQVGTAADWSSVYVSDGNFSLALKSNGTLWAWGENSVGQLGNGTFTNSNIPIQVGSNNDWLIVSPGYNYILATKTNQTLWAWGGNGTGQLGNGSIDFGIDAPVQIGTDNDWLWVDAGFQTSMALKTNGHIWAWGNNFNGIFGNGTNGTSSNVPIQVSATNDWISFNASSHVMARKANGSLWAWGANAFGELGDGTTTDKLSPVQIGTDTDWDEVIAGGIFTLALKNDGTLWHWGDNGFGQYGNGTFFPASLVPLQNPFYNDWETISVTAFTAFGIRNGSNLWGWGSGTNGQIGNGTTSNSNIPNQISCNNILPVTWLYVNGQLQNGNAIIKWATASESNTQKFEIEHSGNGISFSKIGNVTAAGNSSITQHYQFLHNSPAVGKNYYRIKQIDLDGRFSYSSIILLQNKDSKTNIIIAPNPVVNEATLFFNETGNKTLQLLTTGGQIVYTEKINGTNNSHTINMSKLASGIYVLRLQTENGIKTYKIIKQ